MQVVSVMDEPGPGWDNYVAGHPDQSLYHRADWVRLPRDTFGHSPFFLEVRDGAVLRGILPLVEQRSLLFGSFMTSLPFFNYGGVLADSDDMASMLMDRARELAISRGCSYLELRDVRQRPGSWVVRTDKVGMARRLPGRIEELSQQLGSKLRSQVKRADRENPRVEVGGPALLHDFYGIFARTMRDLGTPVYPARFFRSVLERGGDSCRLLVVYLRQRPVAAGLLITHRGRTEIPWAACHAEAKPLGMNMKLYWEALAFAVRQGSDTFDFGRSTVNAGTYRFKQQWGAEPSPLHWHRWERNGAGTGSAARAASKVWKHLPLPVANLVGPWLSPALPW